MPMTFEGAAVATTLEGAEQVIARGPVAAEVSIKQLGTNGGGYFGPNSTHPFENPSPWSNLIELVSIVLLPMGTIAMFGFMLRDGRHAAVVFGVMLALCVAGADVRHPQRGRAERRDGRPGGRAGAEHGGQGGPDRPGRRRHVGGVHHGDLQRLGRRRCTTASTRWPG